MPYDDAAVFLARALPWPPLLAAQPEWFVNIHAPWRMSNGKMAYGGRACTTVNEAINFIGWKLSDPRQATDIYVCMSGQRTAKAKTDKAGRTYWTAIRGVHNALWHKGFYIDIDVKAGAYSDSAAALKALGAFVEAVDLPMPSYVIASGSGGYHVHWTIADAISTEVWQPLAQALVTAMRQHGFTVDYACTADAARLLRVPGTLNYKHLPPKPVDLKHAGTEYPLSRIADVLLTYKSMAVSNVIPLKRRQNNIDMPPGIVGNLAPNAPPFKELVANQQESLPTLTVVADACPFVKQAVLTGGRDYLQPLWWETAKLAFYTSRGRAGLHDMSKLHHQYTPKETDELYDRIERERTPTDMFGWPRCDTIETAGARECGACKWKIAGRTLGKSPLHFVGEPITGPVTNGAAHDLLPDPYRFDEIGRIWEDETDDKGHVKSHKVIPYCVRNFDVTYDPAGLRFETNTDQRGWRSVSIEAKDFEPRKLMSHLAEQSFPLNPNQARRAGYLMPSFTEQLRDRAKSSVPADSSGWVWEDGKPVAFVYGKMRYNCEGDRPSAMFDINLQRMYTPTGSPDPWRKAVRMITDQKRAALQAIVAASFGAPLMEFTGENGLVLVFRSSESGVYKTSAMKVGMAIWANPKEAMHQTTDTSNSILQKASVMKNYPIMCDEVHVDRQSAALFAFINLFSGGKGKAALHRDRSQQIVGTWATFAIMASNRSVRQLAADHAKGSNAALYRVFESYVDPPVNKLGYNDDAQILLNDINNNFGYAGEIFAKYCGMHPAELKIRTENAQKLVRQTLNATEAERFWVAGIACILLGAKIANEIGLTEFDLPLLTDFLKQEFIKNRQHIEGSDVGLHTAVNVVNFISGFVNDPRHFLLHTSTAPGVGKPGTIRSLNGEQPKGTDMCGQMVDDPAELRLSKRVLETYCKQQGYQAGPTIDELVKKLGARKEKQTIGGGTSMSTRAQEILFVFDRNHPDLKDLFS